MDGQAANKPIHLKSADVTFQNKLFDSAISKIWIGEIWNPTTVPLQAKWHLVGKPIYKESNIEAAWSWFYNYLKKTVYLI